MAWEVIFSARSRNDFEQIVKYIARDDPVAAERFGLKLVAQADLLSMLRRWDQRSRKNPTQGFFLLVLI